MGKLTAIILLSAALLLVSCNAKEQEARISELSSKVETLEMENAKLEEKLAEDEKELEKLRAKDDDISHSVAALEESLREEMKTQLSRVEVLEKDMLRHDEALKRLREAEEKRPSPAYLDIVFDLEGMNLLSDRGQVSAALQSGGEIYVSSDYSYLKDNWNEIELDGRKLDLADYGAVGESGTYYTRGAMINLTVQQGWKLFFIDYGYDSIIIYHFTR